MIRYFPCFPQSDVYKSLFVLVHNAHMYTPLMSKVVRAMPAPRDTSPRYDWDKIFNGEVHHFSVAEVPSTPRNFAKQVHIAAAKRGIKISIVARARQGVYVQRLPD